MIRRTASESRDKTASDQYYDYNSLARVANNITAAASPMGTASNAKYGNSTAENAEIAEEFLSFSA